MANKNFRLKVFEKAALARNFEEEVIKYVNEKRIQIRFMFLLDKNLSHQLFQLSVI